MPGRSAEDPRLTRITKICHAFPESVRAVHGDHADFRVRKRVYAYFLSNHHGDGIVSVCCKLEMGQNVERVSRDPQRYYLPAYIGKRGWFGLRLDVGRIDWKEVENVLELSYCLVAPSRLAATVMSGARR